jgi:hypothetical protein
MATPNLTYLKQNAATVAAFCQQHLVLRGASLGNEYFYQSLPLCVIDAVYSIGVRYEGVQNVVRRYCDCFRLKEFRTPRHDVPRASEQESLAAFVAKIDAMGLERMTTEVYQNRQRTSARNGIPKSEAVVHFASALRNHGLNYLQDVPLSVSDSALEADLRRVRGQSSGISTRYFFMLAGTESLIKPDRWIGRFLKLCLNAESTSDEAQFLIGSACEMLRTKYPDLTPRLLDNVIWKYERERKWTTNGYPTPK